MFYCNAENVINLITYIRYVQQFFVVFLQFLLDVFLSLSFFRQIKVMQMRRKCIFYF